MRREKGRRGGKEAELIHPVLGFVSGINDDVLLLQHSERWVKLREKKIQVIFKHLDVPYGEDLHLFDLNDTVSSVQSAFSVPKRRSSRHRHRERDRDRDRDRSRSRSPPQAHSPHPHGFSNDLRSSCDHCGAGPQGHTHTYGQPQYPQAPGPQHSPVPQPLLHGPPYQGSPQPMLSPVCPGRRHGALLRPRCRHNHQSRGHTAGGICGRGTAAPEVRSKRRIVVTAKGQGLRETRKCHWNGHRRSPPPDQRDHRGKKRTL